MEKLNIRPVSDISTTHLDKFSSVQSSIPTFRCWPDKVETRLIAARTVATGGRGMWPVCRYSVLGQDIA